MVVGAIGVVVNATTAALFFSRSQGRPEHSRCLLHMAADAQGLHELHVRGMATSETALTAHLVVDDPQADRNLLLRSATHLLEDRFKIRHVTLQVESAACPSDLRC